ncbi:MAG: hypothetical protein KDB27_02200 [Planctomycetales bacterium]|nr:hypothetical protein [Planctomycetales bacterium]
MKHIEVIAAPAQPLLPQVHELFVCGKQQFFALAVVLALVHGMSPAARAQFGHSDIDFGLDGNKIVTNKRVYDSFFPTFGIARHFSSNPGFAAESDGLGTLDSEHDVFYDVLEGLRFWDGNTFVSLDETVHIRIENNPRGAEPTIVHRGSGIQLGSVTPPRNRVGASSGSGEVHSHVNFFLENDSPESGAYGIKIAITTDTEQITDSDPVFLVFNYGLDASTFETGLLQYEALLDASALLGDFDGNGSLDIQDINLITTALLENSSDPKFNMNGDNLVDQNDRTYWIESIRSTYLGDSNLDGEFSSADFVQVFQANEYEDGVADNSTWAEGDWNGDGDFNTTDFVAAFQAGGYERGPRLLIAVPESASEPWMWAVSTVFLGLLFRKRFRLVIATELATDKSVSRLAAAN